MAEKNNVTKTPEEKNDNLVVRAAKWVWRNKWTILGSFVAGASAGALGDHMLSSRGKDDKPTMGNDSTML